MVLATVLFAAVAAQADTISFDALAGTPDYTPVPPTYGSTATVGVSYASEQPSPEVTLTAYIDFWNSGGYGDLRYAAFASSPSLFGEITLTPVAGYSLTLYSFDLAGYFTADHLGISIFIEDGAGSTLQDLSGTVRGGCPNPCHSHYTPGGTVNGPGLTVNGPLSIEWGPDWNVGINNINFDAAPIGAPVPDPASTASLLLFGTGVVAVTRRRFMPRR